MSNMEKEKRELSDGRLDDIWTLYLEGHSGANDNPFCGALEYLQDFLLPCGSEHDVVSTDWMASHPYVDKNAAYKYEKSADEYPKTNKPEFIPLRQTGDLMIKTDYTYNRDCDTVQPDFMFHHPCVDKQAVRT